MFDNVMTSSVFAYLLSNGSMTLKMCSKVGRDVLFFAKENKNGTEKGKKR